MTQPGFDAWESSREAGQPDPHQPPLPGPPLPGPQTPGQGLPEIVPMPAQHLPVHRPETGPTITGFMGDVVRTGRWQAPRRTVAWQLMGDLKLDLREVLQPGETLEVNANLFMGDVKVLVPPGTQIEVQGVTLMGDATTEVHAAAQGAEPNGSRVVVTVNSFMGDVKVRAMGLDVAPPRGWRWARPKQ